VAGVKARISPKLSELASFFDKRRDRKTELSGGNSAMLAEQLEILVAMSLSMEQELEVFRLLEANRAGRRFMEEEAAEAMRPAVIGGGQVLRPDFWRKS